MQPRQSAVPCCSITQAGRCGSTSVHWGIGNTTDTISVTVYERYLVHTWFWHIPLQHGRQDVVLPVDHGQQFWQTCQYGRSLARAVGGPGCQNIG